jgi:hypothetical protein
MLNDGQYNLSNKRRTFPNRKTLHHCIELSATIGNEPNADELRLRKLRELGVKVNTHR